MVRSHHLSGAPLRWQSCAWCFWEPGATCRSPQPGVASTPAGSTAMKGEFFPSQTAVTAERGEPATEQSLPWILFSLQYTFQHTCVSPTTTATCTNVPRKEMGRKRLKMLKTAFLGGKILGSSHFQVSGFIAVVVVVLP